jgi:hypothetical protein
MKLNLLTPQAYLQYTLFKQGLATGQSSFGGNTGFQKKVALAKLSGAYKPSCVISKIKNPSGHGKDYRLERDFLNIENHKLSLLVPEIRLYRVEGKQYTPFYFPVTTDYNFTTNGQYDKTRAFSANSAVLKSFNIDFVGNSPFDAGLGMLETSLEVEIDSLSTLFSRPNDSFAELADLILMRVPESKRLPNSGKTPEVGALESGRALEIAATIGYSFMDKDGILTTKEKKAIDATKLLVSMHYKGRDISIQQNGSATISARYHGSLKAVDKDFIYNVVEKAETKKKLLEIRTDAKPNSGKKEPQDIKTAVPGDKAKQENSAASNSSLEKPDYMLGIVSEVSRVIDNLHRKEKIFAVPIAEDAQQFLKFGTKPAAANDKSSPAPPSTAGRVQDNILTGDYVFYVNFGDLVDAFMAKIADQDFNKIKSNIKTDLKNKRIKPKQEQKMLKSLQESQKFLQLTNVFFSDMTLQPKGKKGELAVNISDIPISIDLIYTAIYEDYIQPRKYFFGLKEFLVSFCAGLLNDALAEYSGSDIMKKAKVKVSTLQGTDLSEKIRKGKGSIDVKHLDTDTAKLIKSKQKQKAQYVIYHQERCDTSGTIGRGNQIEDQDSGIIHLRTSQDRGLVKSINFSAQNQPGLEEYLIVGHGNAFDALRIPHNATVTMFGNTLFHPLMMVYIDPEALGLGEPASLDSSTRKLGIGGYYSVIKVTTSFTSGVLNTTLQLQFAGYPETIGEAKRMPGAVKADKEVEDLMQRSKSLNKKK